jgi:type I restriction enzyme, S subunit
MSTGTIKYETKRIPRLRFAGFSEEWQQKKLGSIFSKQQKRNSENKHECILTNSASRGIVKQSDYFNKDIANRNNLTNYFIVDIDDFIYNPRISKHAPVGPLKRNNLEKGIVSPLYTILKLRKGNSIFFETYFDTNKWHRYMYKIANYGARHDRMNILQNDFLAMPVSFPHILEQQKIAKFLRAIEKLHNNLLREKELLEIYKKGVMQKIFSQEIRFKNNNGREFPEWNEKSMSEIGESFNGLTGKRGEDFGSGESFITYKQIFDDSEINIDKFSLVKISVDEKQNKTQFGDVFFTTSSETPLEVGFASVLLDKNITPYLNSFSFGFRPNSLKECNPYYTRFFFRSSIFRREVVKLAQGSTRYNISKFSFMKIKIRIPSFLEQQKIAEFLTPIDNLINLKQKQIVQTKEWRKGLMQGLFI